MVKNIVLDFGHGGIDKNGNYTTAPKKMKKFHDGVVAYEGVINRQIGALLLHFLQWEFPHLNIVTTVKPNDARDISLSYRVRVANQYNPKETIFLSIHSNASPNGNARGFEVFTTKGQTKSDTLAEMIYQQVNELYDPLNLKMRKDLSDGDHDKEIDFYVLRKTTCPAVLLECLFFDNRDDFNLLNSTHFQKELAHAIFEGVAQYLSSH